MRMIHLSPLYKEKIENKKKDQKTAHQFISYGVSSVELQSPEVLTIFSSTISNENSIIQKSGKNCILNPFMLNM